MGSHLLEGLSQKGNQLMDLSLTLTCVKDTLLVPSSVSAKGPQMMLPKSNPLVQGKPSAPSHQLCTAHLPSRGFQRHCRFQAQVKGARRWLPYIYMEALALHVHVCL